MSKLCETGDKGQRYEVRGERDDGREIVMGWTDAADGGALKRSGDLWPALKRCWVVDRKPEVCT